MTASNNRPTFGAGAESVAAQPNIARTAPPYKRQRVELLSDPTRAQSSRMQTEAGASPKRMHIASPADARPPARVAVATPSSPSTPGHRRPPPLATKPPQPPSSASASRPGPLPAVPARKRRFTRSRSGCATCRVRKIKCDETRPHCHRCLEDDRQCEYFRSAGSARTEAEVKSQAEPSGADLHPAAPAGKPARLSQHQQPHHSPRQTSVRHTRPGPAHQLSSIPTGDASTSGDITSPKHLDDWLDLLCASIGNDIQHASGSATADASQPVAKRDDQLSDTSRQSTAQGSAPSVSDSQSDRSASRDRLKARYGRPTAAASAIADHTLAFGSAEARSPNWLDDDWLSTWTASPSGPTGIQHTFDGASATPVSASTTAARPGLQHIPEAELQRRIRALCVTRIQLESVSFFFNTTARCFHLLSADTNVWRIFFAQLAAESPMVLDLAGCLGLTHLSLAQDHRKKGLAHAHFSRCKTEWDAFVGPLHTPELIALAAEQINSAHRALELLAGTILIAHVEQFSRGFATSSRAYTALAITVIRQVLAGAPNGTPASWWVNDLDQGPASAFRFFVRILLWWETMSRTMGPASEQGDVLDIFEHVYRWDESDSRQQDPIECSTQCVVGWPLDLLEAVERINRLSAVPEIVAFVPPPASSVPLVMPSGSLSHALEDHVPLETQLQIDAIESQIRLSRPMPLTQDDSLAAELRYLIFECLQSASLVYFCRTLLKSTDAAWFEIDKVTRFLERKQQRLRTSGEVKSAGPSCPQDPTGDLQVAHAMETRGKWWIRAPDGALIWAYFQCASEIFGELDASLESSPLVVSIGGIETDGINSAEASQSSSRWDRTSSLVPTPTTASRDRAQNAGSAAVARCCCGRSSTRSSASFSAGSYSKPCGMVATCTSTRRATGCVSAKARARMRRSTLLKTSADTIKRPSLRTSADNGVGASL